MAGDRQELEELRRLDELERKAAGMSAPDIQLTPPVNPAASTAVAPPDLGNAFPEPKQIGLSAGMTPATGYSGQMNDEGVSWSDVLMRSLAQSLETVSQSPVKVTPGINDAMRERQTVGQNAVADVGALAPYFIPYGGQALFASEIAKNPEMIKEMLTGVGKSYANLGVLFNALQNKPTGAITASQAKEEIKRSPVGTALNVALPVAAAFGGLKGGLKVGEIPGKLRAVRDIAEGKPSLKVSEPKVSLKEVKQPEVLLKDKGETVSNFKVKGGKVKGNEGKSDIVQEASKYKNPKDFESAFSVKKQLENNKIPINNDGTVTLYHATLPDRADTIKSQGIIKGGSTATGGMTGLALKPSAFFGVNKEWVKNTWGHGLDNIIEVKVPFEYIRQPAQNAKEVYFEGGLKLIDKQNNIWQPIKKPRDTFYNKLPAKDYNWENPNNKLSQIWNKSQFPSKVKGGRVVEKPPIKSTEPPVKAPVESETIGLNKREITQMRKDYEFDKLSKPQRKGFEQSVSEAIETKTKDNALEIADDVLASKRAVTDVEHAGMALKATELVNNYESMLSEISKQAERGNKQGVKTGRKNSNVVLDQIEKLTRAADYAGTEAGRALSIRGMLINRQDYSVAKLKIDAKATKGSDLSPIQNKKIEDLAVKHKDLSKKVADLEKRYADILANEEKVLAERIHQRELNKVKITRKTAAAKKQIVSDRENIKNQIRELGIRVNEATGVSAEGSYLIGKLAVNYIKEGAATLADVTKKVLNDIPDITERDVYKALNAKDPARQAKARTEAQKTIGLLKREARLLVDIENAEKGIFKTPQKGDKVFGAQSETLQNIKNYQAKLRGLRANFNKTISDGRRLERAFKTLHELQDQLENHSRNIKKKKATDRDILQSIKQKSMELRKLMRTQDEITNLNEQLRTGDFVIKEKKTLKRQPQDLEKAQVELNLLRKKVRMTIEEMAPLTPRKIGREVVNTLRVFKATADMSYALRQGLILSVSRPGLAVKSFGRAFQATFSEMKAAEIDNALRQAPHHYIREMAGLDLPEIGGKLTKREELFMSNWAEKIPGYKYIIKASERNMTTGLNMLRAGVFDEFLNKFPNASLPEMKAMAEYINVASGRGNLGKFSNAADVLSTIFFAPRFAASRFQTPYMIFKNWKNPRIRNIIAKDLAAVGGLGLTVLSLAKLGGYEVGTDYNDSEFGKIRVGNTRIDMWAGFQQPMRLLVQIPLNSVQGKAEWGKSPIELITRFSQYKLAPIWTTGQEIITGRSIVGEKVDPTDIAVRSITPLVYDDIKRAYEEGGIDRAAMTAGLGFFGVGVNTYQRSTWASRKLNSIKKKYGIEGD